MRLVEKLPLGEHVSYRKIGLGRFGIGKRLSDNRIVRFVYSINSFL